MEKTSKSDEKMIAKRQKRLKELRKEKNLTQEQVANMAHISQVHYQRIESGNSNLTLDMACALSKVFGVRTEYLLCEDDFKTELMKKTYPAFKEWYDEDRAQQALNKYFEVFGIVFEPWAGEELNKKLSEIKGEGVELIGGLGDLLLTLSEDEAKRLFHPCFLIKTKKGEKIATISDTEYKRLAFEIKDYIDFLFTKITEGR